MITDCAVIVLASGRSSRFGAEDKLLADLGGKPLIAHALEAVSEYETVIVVIPNNAAALQNYLAEFDLSVLVNEEPDAGQGRSLSLGAGEVLYRGFNRSIVLLADMPFIHQSQLASLVDAAQAHSVVISQTTSGLTLPPACFSGSALKRLTALSGDQGARALFNHAEVFTVPMTDKSAIDIDTLDDLDKVRAIFEESTRHG